MKVQVVRDAGPPFTLVTNRLAVSCHIHQNSPKVPGKIATDVYARTEQMIYLDLGNYIYKFMGKA